MKKSFSIISHVCSSVQPTLAFTTYSACLSTTTVITNKNQEKFVQKDPELANAKSFDEIPGLKGRWNSLKLAAEFLPIFGKHRNGIKALNELHKERHDEFGKIVRVDLLNRLQFVMVYDPNDIQKVFRHEGHHPYRVMLHGLREYRKTNPQVYPSTGILTENGLKWFNIRSKVQVPMLRPLIVETYIPKMAEVAEDFVENMKYMRDSKKEIPDYLNEMYKWALESIGLIALNTRLGCLKRDDLDSETQQLIKAVNVSMETISQMEFGIPFWKYFPSKSYRQFVESQEFVFRIALKYFNKTLEEIKKHKDDSSAGGILGVYIRNGDLDQNEIRTFMLDLLQAGIDTTSHTMAFTLYLLAQNQEKQEKAYEEIKRVLPSQKGNISPNDMPYLRACIKESLRMLTVVEGTLRILDHDIALSGYHVPAGVLLILLSQVASILPENFDNPEKFLPERWLENKKPHAYSNLPFGHGPRMCIGRRIAVQEIHILLTKILQNFKVEYHYEDIHRLTRFVSMPDKPLRFAFIDRE